MNDLDLKQSIRNSLQSFSRGAFHENAVKLFKTLGYQSERSLGLDSSSFSELAQDYPEFQKINQGKALVSDWVSVNLLFQLTAPDIQNYAQTRFVFDSNGRVDHQIIESYLFMAIELNQPDYPRSKLADLTREINKLFPMPVMILFKHGQHLTFSMINRRLNLKAPEKDVLEKVTLIKGIDIAQPVRGHVEILFDLSLHQLQKDTHFHNFIELHQAWQKKLDTSELNKKFYREIANWYFWAVNRVEYPIGAGEDPEQRHATSVIRLITRLIFVWFIKEKGLVPDALFDPAELQNILNYSDPKSSTYYKAILQNLFFATLNTEMGSGRQFRHKNPNPHGRDGNYGDPYLYRYQDYFNNPPAALKLFADIPFLNGGLFECLDKREENTFIDGFSDNQKNQPVVPDELFFGSDQTVNLNTIYGDIKHGSEKVRGIIHIFNNYKFTVEENTPLEEEIALDPELLGKVFENLLAAYNPETGTTARKQTGSFYTPREIVNYMVDESLIAYLETKLAGAPDLQNRLCNLIAYNQQPDLFSPQEDQKLISAIDQIKVLDPACGSGAFPMGMLHKLVYILSKLDPNNTYWREIQKKKAISETEGAYQIGDPEERRRRLLDIDEAFENNASDYGRKLYLIENCIYGIDIQAIAVQIAKLRFFISLVVDQGIDSSRPNFGIRPLPNLETKFVVANTLIGIERPNSSKPEDDTLSSISTDVIEKSTELLDIFRQYLLSRIPNRRASLLESGIHIGNEINQAMSETPNWNPIQVDWIFSTKSKLEDLRKLLPVTQPEKVSAPKLETKQIQVLEGELATIRAKMFTARTLEYKRNLRLKDRLLRGQISELLKSSGWDNASTELLAKWDPYDQNASAGFFDPEMMFGVVDGFDIVIGNPPYINAKTMQKENPQLRIILKNTYKLLAEKWDIYLAFIEKALNLSRQASIITMIIPNAFVSENYAKGMRAHVVNNKLLRNINFYNYDIFEAAVKNIVLVIQKPNSKDTEHRVYTDPTTYSSKLVGIGNFFDSTDTQLARLFNSELSLGDICFITVGMVLNADETIANGEFIKDDLICETKDEIHNKSYTEGKWIDKFEIKTIKYLEWGTNRVPKKIRRATFPELYTKEKLLVNKLGSIKATYDDTNIYCDQTIRLLVKYIDLQGINNNSINNSIKKYSKKSRAELESLSIRYDLKFILALLNTSLYQYLLEVLRTSESFDINPQVLRKLPVPAISNDEQRPFIALVDAILESKQTNPQSDTKEMEEKLEKLTIELLSLTKEEIAVFKRG